MTAKEYLNQGYRLEHRIKLHKTELEELRELSVSVSSPGFEEHYSATKNTDAPFEKVLFKIMEMEHEQAAMLEKLLTFKQELVSVINAVEDKDEQLVLHYRYICNRTWADIGDLLGWDERTIRRLHNRALSHVEIPKHPTILDRR